MRGPQWAGPLPLARVLRNIRTSRERESLAQLNKQVGIQESIREVMEAAQERRMDSASEEREVIDENIERLVYGSAGLHVSRDGPNFTIVDFAMILDGMETIHYSSPSESYLVTRLDGDTTELKGDNGRAFLRYLRFLGLFEAVRLRTDCPKCILPEWLDPGMDPEHPERPCPECGGLAWVLDEAAE